MMIASVIIPGSGATMNRCKYCNEICPDFSDMCDLCYMLEKDVNIEELNYLEQWSTENDEEF